MLDSCDVVDVVVMDEEVATQYTIEAAATATYPINITLGYEAAQGK